MLSNLAEIRAQMSEKQNHASPQALRCEVSEADLGTVSRIRLTPFFHMLSGAVKPRRAKKRKASRPKRGKHKKKGSDVAITVS